MNIEIRDRALEARIQRQTQATDSETQKEQDRWLPENRELNNAKIRRGIEQLDRCEGIPDDRLDASPRRVADQA